MYKHEIILDWSRVQKPNMFLRSIQIFQHFCQSVILISNQPFISSRIVCSGIAWIYPLEVSWQDYLHAWPSAPWGCWVQATASIWKAAIWWVWDQGCKLPSWGGTMLWCVYSSLCLKGSWCFLPMKQVYGIMTGMLKATSSCKSESPNLRFGSNFRRRLDVLDLHFIKTTTSSTHSHLFDPRFARR